MTLGERLRGLLELCRPANAVVAGVLTLIGAYVAGRPFARGALVAAFATVFATAAGNAINDYFDREIDAINDPGRPIPRGAVPPRGALAFSAVLFAAAIVLALLLPAFAIGVAVVNLVALVAYTKLFKGLPGAGNAVVAYLGGSTFLFGAAAVERPFAAAVLFALAALSTFAREVIKDVEDVAGDREEGLHTLPIAVGERRACWLGAAVLAVAILASPLPYLRDLFGVAYLVVVVPADFVMAYAAYAAFDDPARAQGLLKYGMFLAAAAFVVGRALV
ncbi:(S)-2,3-di-O-geranylgeranylglyceryl phosphate synthase [Halarchaeum acidiphilum MH1-52-1]|uniref:Digeranylgeranylglyceryl phosphate synthase n=1 Tax=Halarchaeum acidiphilum MH1-52-1 TaxID=1261545 RepID=U2YW31_9EURY|nr:geranylgeranylglycerol-phosphate geranylgeranyltransferase [Halarchaeum acidiphilum]GAD53235.1 (S)-2,3-di-O-geranylgeranylglyceryl phosphate synthase [Halarchaeum acidiphilum MH1-52-1]